MILQLNSLIDYYSIFPGGKIGKKHVLFPTHTIGHNLLVMERIPLFYQQATQMLHRICAERGLELQEDDLESLVYILLVRWHDLTANFMEKYYDCRILVASHLTLSHSKAIVSTLQTELSPYCTFATHPGNNLTKETLQDLQFDVLVVTKTVQLDIPQPILYMDGKAMPDRMQLLRQMAEQTVEQNKELYLATVKERMRQKSLTPV